MPGIDVASTNVYLKGKIQIYSSERGGWTLQYHQTSTNIKHQTSYRKHQTSDMKHETSDMKQQTLNIKHQTSSNT